MSSKESVNVYFEGPVKKEFTITLDPVMGTGYNCQRNYSYSVRRAYEGNSIVIKSISDMYLSSVKNMTYKRLSDKKGKCMIKDHPLTKMLNKEMSRCDILLLNGNIFDCFNNFNLLYQRLNKETKETKSLVNEREKKKRRLEKRECESNANKRTPKLILPLPAYSIPGTVCIGDEGKTVGYYGDDEGDYSHNDGDDEGNERDENVYLSLCKEEWNNVHNIFSEFSSWFSKNLLTSVNPEGKIIYLTGNSDIVSRSTINSSVSCEIKFLNFRLFATNGFIFQSPIWKDVKLKTSRGIGSVFQTEYERTALSKININRYCNFSKQKDFLAIPYEEAAKEIAEVYDYDIIIFGNSMFPAIKEIGTSRQYVNTGSSTGFRNYTISKVFLMHEGYTHCEQKLITFKHSDSYLSKSQILKEIKRELTSKNNNHDKEVDGEGDICGAKSCVLL